MSKSNQNIISTELLAEIKDALESVKYGSIEIFVQNRVVNQITVRNIHKTSVELSDDEVNISMKNHIQKNSVKANQ